MTFRPNATAADCCMSMEALPLPLRPVADTDASREAEVEGGREAAGVRNAADDGRLRHCFADSETALVGLVLEREACLLPPMSSEPSPGSSVIVPKVSQSLMEPSD